MQLTEWNLPSAGTGDCQHRVCPAADIFLEQFPPRPSIWPHSTSKRHSFTQGTFLVLVAMLILCLTNQRLLGISWFLFIIWQDSRFHWTDFGMSPFNLIVVDFSSQPNHWHWMPPRIILIPKIKVMHNLKLVTVVWKRVYAIVQV